MDPSVYEFNWVFFRECGGRRLVVGSHTGRYYLLLIDPGRPAGVALARAL